jgi:uncharacterized protein
MNPPSDRAPAVAPIPAHAGMGLRFAHHAHVLAARPPVPWFEVHPENYVSGQPLEVLAEIRESYPISFHGVGMSLGSADPPDTDHLARLSRLIEQIEPGLVSDHLTWSRVDGEYLADLLPLPYTEEALAVVARNLDAAQTALGRRLLIENPSRYFRLIHSTLSEAEFMGELVRRTGCGLLCDINNIHVSAHNLGLDAAELLDAFPWPDTDEIHLAGHARVNLPEGVPILIDNHGARIAPDVWALFDRALARAGAIPTLIEWDTDVPAFSLLENETALAQARIARIRAGTPYDRAA